MPVWSLRAMHKRKQEREKFLIGTQLADGRPCCCTARHRLQVLEDRIPQQCQLSPACSNTLEPPPPTITVHQYT